eukprot:g1040.t1
MNFCRSSLTRLGRRRPRNVHLAYAVSVTSSRSRVPIKNTYSMFRHFSTETTSDSESAQDNNKASDEETSTAENDANNEDAEAKAKEEEQADPLEAVQAELKEMKEKYLFALSEQENIRRIANKDIEKARSFGIEKFAKKLLDTADNFARAREHVKQTDLDANQEFKGFYDGVLMTETNFVKCLEHHKVIKFGEVGDVFNPQNHEALFEMDDPEKEVGTVGQIIKHGYFLNERVLRPAQVATIRARD